MATAAPIITADGARHALDGGKHGLARPLCEQAPQRVPTYSIAFGPRAGQKVLTLQGSMPTDGDFKQTLRADNKGFSLHAAVRCGVADRQALEQLYLYITRPALAHERVQTNADGQVVLKLKTPWRDVTTHLVMSLLECMQPSIERPVCGGQIRWVYDCIGSAAPVRGHRMQSFSPDPVPVDVASRERPLSPSLTFSAA